MQPRDVYSFSPISLVGFFIGSFFSSDEKRSPALGRITMLSFPSVLLLTSTCVLGEENSRISLFLDEKSSLRVCVDGPGCILIETLLEPASNS